MLGKTLCLLMAMSFCAGALGGCSADHMKRGVYEGVRVRNDLQSSPQERIGRPETPPYPEYERLKKEQGR